MSEYAGQQFVGIDLHRRRSVLVRTTTEVLTKLQVRDRTQAALRARGLN